MIRFCRKFLERPQKGYRWTHLCSERGELLKWRKATG